MPPLPDDAQADRRHWERIETLLDELIGIAPDRRAAAAERLAVGDAALSAELMSLVRRIEQTPPGGAEAKQLMDATSDSTRAADSLSAASRAATASCHCANAFLSASISACSPSRSAVTARTSPRAASRASLAAAMA